MSKSSPPPNCLLCASDRVIESPTYGDGQSYLHCGVCDVRTLVARRRLKSSDEKARYTFHQTGPADTGYLEFVRPLLERVGTLNSTAAAGLDYGAGHQPVLSEHLRKMGYKIEIYDPFFWPDPTVLRTGAYDFVVACEVIEHFYAPAAEFMRMRSYLRPGGSLILNTEVFTSQTNFETWYYRRDPTHVTFYSAETFAWLAHHFRFARVEVGRRVVSLSLPAHP